MTSETIDIVKQTADELLAQIGLDLSVAVSLEEELVVIQIETDEPGILIGFHGKNLESLQNIISQIVFKKTGEWIRLVVNVGDYRERRDKQLKEMAFEAAAAVVESKQPVTLADLSSSERRVVHLTLQDHPEVTSSSEGEGLDRRLVVSIRPVS